MAVSNTKDKSGDKSGEHGGVQSEPIDTVSDCGNYRYQRRIALGGGTKGTCTIIGLMPQPPGSEENRQVLEACTTFAARLGYGTLILVNLFAIIPQDNMSQQTAVSPVGPANDPAIMDAVHNSQMVVCAWGDYPRIGNRVYAVLDMLKDVDLYCVQTNRNGSPTHPMAWKQKAAKIYRRAVRESLPAAG